MKTLYPHTITNESPKRPSRRSFGVGVYLDNAAATPIDKRVWQAMTASLKASGNPSSFNDSGRTARDLMAKARKTIADFLGARTDEIVFTSSGSEANNLAIQGFAKAFKSNPKNKNSKPHIITTKIEHPSVLESVKQLSGWGFGVTYLPVDKQGLINLKELEKALRSDTVLVSVMYANNEIGTIEPIKQIAKILKNHKALLHVDACQAAGFLDMNVQLLGVDLLTFNGSKIYGPRGIGVLYIRRGTPIMPLIVGGGQERGLKAGTENQQAIVGLAKAVSLIKKDEAKKISEVRDYAISKIKKEIPDAILNGPEPAALAGRGDSRLANNLNICVPDLTSEVLLLELDKYGISAGSGSACTSHSVEPSHVLKAIGVSKSYINGAMRFSLGLDTTKKDVDYLVVYLKRSIKDLHKIYKK